MAKNPENLEKPRKTLINKNKLIDDDLGLSAETLDQLEPGKRKQSRKVAPVARNFAGRRLRLQPLPGRLPSPELAAKIAYAEALIRYAMPLGQKPVVACSFGKDSMVVLHMVMRQRRDVQVVFNNTLVEFPDTIRFSKEITEAWKLDMIEVKPKRKFFDIVEEKGFPIRSRGGARAKGKKYDPKIAKESAAAESCCAELKKKPMKETMQVYGWDLIFDGLMASENEMRRMMKYIYGPIHHVKSWDALKCHPIQEWSEADVWAYHELYGIAHNEVYDKPLAGYQVRTGCWPCTIGAPYGKIEHLRIYYPKMWEALVVKKGFGKEILKKRLDLDDAEAAEINTHELAKLAEARPCFFDTL